MDNLESFLAAQSDTSGNTSVLLRDVAYERIKDAIQHGVLQPGQPLTETRLSQLLGISRTPVREALQSLAQEGLVQIIPGRAVTVKSPSIDDALSAIHVRSILEPEVVRLTTESITAHELDRLWQALREMEEAVADGDRAVWSKADTRFHDILNSSCPNQLLGDLAMQMRNRVSYVAIDVQTSPERLARCTDEHRQIVERIAARDAHGAERTVREHLQKLRDSTFRKYHFS